MIPWWVAPLCAAMVVPVLPWVYALGVLKERHRCISIACDGVGWARNDVAAKLAERIAATMATQHKSVAAPSAQRQRPASDE